MPKTAVTRKRKSTPSTPPIKKRKAVEAEPNVAVENEPCHFLRLPAELRNEIYALVCGCKDEKAILVARNRGKLAHRSSLLRVNHQVRNEFMPVLCTTAPTICAHVKDFNFAHIVTFFNRCNEIELKTLPGAGDLSDDQRQMTIVLEVTGNTPIFTDRLERWINRSVRSEKQGSAVKLEYRVGADSHELGETVFMVDKMYGKQEEKAKKRVLWQVLQALYKSGSHALI